MATFGLLLWSLSGTRAVEASHDRELIQVDGQREIYWVQNGKRYHVQNEPVMNAMARAGVPGWGFGKQKFVSSAHLRSYSNRSSILSSDSEGVLVQAYGTGEVYLINGGRRRHIEDEQAMTQGGYSFSDVIDVTRSLLDSIPTGTTIRAQATPAATPTSTPRATSTPNPTSTPTPQPTRTPTPHPTSVPTPRPTSTPTPSRNPAAGVFREPVSAENSRGCGFNVVCANETPHHAGIDYFADAAYATTRGVVASVIPNHVTCPEPTGGRTVWSNGKLRRNGCDDHGMGNTAIVKHVIAGKDPVYSLYTHLASIDVREGQCVAAGDRIGMVGGTGQGDPDYWVDHLHFEIKNEDTITAPGSPGGKNYGYTPTLIPTDVGYRDPDVFLNDDNAVAEPCTPTTTPSPTAPNGANSGAVYGGELPRGPGLAIIEIVRDTDAATVSAQIRSAGCQPRTLSMLRFGFFTAYIPGARDFVNATFPSRLNVGDRLVVLCL
ncbi:MAG: M23 family metallopeptidase [Dehalococcoidia bacterium]|nr:MAG: M23 family metallopeptidase [Dehalococcoidia bacterium]